MIRNDAYNLTEEDELWQCWDCSNLFDYDDMNELGGRWYCPYCLDVAKEEAEAERIAGEEQE